MVAGAGEGELAVVDEEGGGGGGVGDGVCPADVGEDLEGLGGTDGPAGVVGRRDLGFGGAVNHAVLDWGWASKWRSGEALLTNLQSAGLVSP